MRETAKILQKSKSWVAKWSSSQDFSDRPKGGRPTVLDRTAKKIIEKAKDKRGSSTRKISKQLKNKDLPGSAATVWRLCPAKDETFETKKATTFKQQTAEGSLGIRSQIS